MYYFIQKDGIYCHGIFWIGEDLEEGKKELRKAALADSDNYHSWTLSEYVPAPDYSYRTDASHHKDIIITSKDVEEKKEN